MNLPSEAMPFIEKRLEDIHESVGRFVKDFFMMLNIEKENNPHKEGTEEFHEWNQGINSRILGCIEHDDKPTFKEIRKNFDVCRSILESANQVTVEKDNFGKCVATKISPSGEHTSLVSREGEALDRFASRMTECFFDQNFPEHIKLYRGLCGVERDINFLESAFPHLERDPMIPIQNPVPIPQHIPLILTPEFSKKIKMQRDKIFRKIGVLLAKDMDSVQKEIQRSIKFRAKFSPKPASLPSKPRGENQETISF